MTGFSFYSLLCGLFLGSLLGGFMCYVALKHNPNMMYSDEPLNLVPIFFIHAAVVFFPFGILTIFLETVMRFRDKKRRKPAK